MDALLSGPPFEAAFLLHGDRYDDGREADFEMKPSGL
jgi:hypothetical protein